jgi:hypothetical protein
VRFFAPTTSLSSIQGGTLANGFVPFARLLRNAPNLVTAVGPLAVVGGTPIVILTSTLQTMVTGDWVFMELGFSFTSTGVACQLNIQISSTGTGIPSLYGQAGQWLTVPVAAGGNFVDARFGMWQVTSGGTISFVVNASITAGSGNFTSNGLQTWNLQGT